MEPELEGRGRVLIRASGTEPVVRVMVEAEQADAAERAAQTWRRRFVPEAEAGGCDEMPGAPGISFPILAINRQKIRGETGWQTRLGNTFQEDLMLSWNCHLRGIEFDLSKICHSQPPVLWRTYEAGQDCRGRHRIVVGGGHCVRGGNYRCWRVLPAPVYSKWADAYQKATGNKVNYQSIGSSGGIKQIGAKTVDFGASDAPLKDEELAARHVQFPTVIGGVVPVINLPGIKPGELVITGDVLANIHRQDQEVGRSCHQGAEPARRCRARHPAGAPCRRFGHHLHLHQLPVQGQRRLEGLRG